MSELTRKCGHPMFMLGQNIAPADCPICPCLHSYREKLAGLVEGLTRFDYAEIRYVGVTGLVPVVKLSEVLNIIHTVEIGETK